MPEDKEETKEKKKEEKKEEPRFQVGQVPETVKPVIIDTKTEEQYDLFTILAAIKNDLEELKEYMMK